MHQPTSDLTKQFSGGRLRPPRGVPSPGAAKLVRSGEAVGWGGFGGWGFLEFFLGGGSFLFCFNREKVLSFLLGVGGGEGGGSFLLWRVGFSLLGWFATCEMHKATLYKGIRQMQSTPLQFNKGNSRSCSSTCSRVLGEIL